MEARKYMTQFNSFELEALNALLHNEDGMEFSFTPYSAKRAKERSITYEEAVAVIQNGKIIEYHFVDANSQRVLMRGKSFDNDDYDICVVLDLFTKEIVTIYFNSSNDKHSTIDMRNYRRSLDVLDCLKKCM